MVWCARESADFTPAPHGAMQFFNAYGWIHWDDFGKTWHTVTGFELGNAAETPARAQRPVPGVLALFGPRHFDLTDLNQALAGIEPAAGPPAGAAPADPAPGGGSAPAAPGPADAAPAAPAPAAPTHADAVQTAVAHAEAAQAAAAEAARAAAQYAEAAQAAAARAAAAQAAAAQAAAAPAAAPSAASSIPTQKSASADDGSTWDTDHKRDEDRADTQQTLKNTRWDTQHTLDNARWDTRHTLDNTRWDAQHTLDNARWDTRHTLDNARWDAQHTLDNARWDTRHAVDNTRWDTYVALRRSREDAALAVDSSLLEAVHGGYIAMAQSSLDRAVQRATYVTTAAGAITTLYTGVLALRFTSGHPALPARCLIPALFVGAAVAFSTWYLAFLRGTTKLSELLPSGLGGGIAQTRLLDFMEWAFAGVLARAWSLRLSVISLALGLALLPIGFVTLSSDAILALGWGGVAVLVAWLTGEFVISRRTPSATLRLEHDLLPPEPAEGFLDTGLVPGGMPGPPAPPQRAGSDDPPEPPVAAEDPPKAPKRADSGDPPDPLSVAAAEPPRPPKRADQPDPPEPPPGTEGAPPGLPDPLAPGSRPSAPGR
jgi:chemotaxis protein histidine kinase CheA